MANLHVRRPEDASHEHGERRRKSRSAKAEKIITWSLWALLLVGGTVVGVFSLVVGTVNSILAIVGAANGQDVGGWPKLAWYFVGGVLLVVLPWPILAVIISGARRRQHVWFWSVAALASAVAITAGLGSVYGFF